MVLARTDEVAGVVATPETVPDMTAPVVRPEVVDGDAGEKLDCPQAIVSANIANTGAQVTSRRRSVIRASLRGWIVPRQQDPFR